MWCLASPELKSGHLDIGEAWRGQIPVRQLWEGDICLSNAINLVSWHCGNGQMTLCDCGVTGCQSGNWVSLRQAGERVLMVPVFTEIDDVSLHIHDDYGPPDYLLRWGGLYFERTQYAKLQIGFPQFEDVPPVTGWEIAKLYQFEAPAQILGKSDATPRLPQDMVVASSTGSFLEQVPQLEGLLVSLLVSDQPITLRPVSPNDTPITFYLDIAGFPEWPALALTEDGLRLYLSPGFVIEC